MVVGSSEFCAVRVVFHILESISKLSVSISILKKNPSISILLILIVNITK